MALTGKLGTSDSEPGSLELGLGTSDITSPVPAFVLATTIPAPADLTVQVPAFILSLSVPTPVAASVAVAPSLTLTLSEPTPTVTSTAVVPAFSLALALPAPAIANVQSVPAFSLALSMPLPYISAVPLIGPIRLWIDRFEVARMEWTMTTEEVLGGVGRATITIQDRNPDSDWEPAAHMDVLAVIRSSGWRLWHGETMQPAVSLPPGMPWRRWTIACRDYNAAFDERAVGAPPGGFWTRPSEKDPYRSVDPNGLSWATDKITAQQWVRYYCNPNAVVFDTGTYVFEYVPNAIMGRPDYIVDLQDQMAILRPALEQVAAIADVNIQFGVDADDRLHWQAIPAWQDLVGNLDPTDLAPAPFAIVDLADDPDGVTAIGHGGIDPGFDGQAMPETVYVQGANTFIRKDNGETVEQGSGWYPFIPTSGGDRQAYLSAPGSWSKDRRDSIGASAIRRAEKPTLRGTIIVDGFTNSDGVRESRDGWRPWQLLSISDARLPASMKPGGRFVIQRVATTLIAGSDVRRYVIDFGDGPVGRMSQGQRKLPPPPAQQPIVVWTCDWEDFGPIAANESRDAVFTPRNGKGDPWGPIGLPVSFRVEARDSDGNLVPGQGFCTPPDTVTGQDGKLRTTLTAGDQDGLFYQVFVETTVAP